MIDHPLFTAVSPGIEIISVGIGSYHMCRACSIGDFTADIFCHAVELKFLDHPRDMTMILLYSVAATVAS